LILNFSHAALERLLRSGLSHSYEKPSKVNDARLKDSHHEGSRGKARFISPREQSGNSAVAQSDRQE